MGLHLCAVRIAHGRGGLMVHCKEEMT